MEQDVDTGYRTLCCTCLSTYRNVTSINELISVHQIFRLLMEDYEGDRSDDSKMELEQLVCWECLAIMKKFARFKHQVHNAQKHLHVLAISQSQETLSHTLIDHTYTSQSLSSLECVTKNKYDEVIDTTQDLNIKENEVLKTEWPTQYISVDPVQGIKNEVYDVTEGVREHINLSVEDQNVEEVMVDNTLSSVMSHIVVDPLAGVKGELPELTIDPTTNPDKVVITQKCGQKTTTQNNFKSGYNAVFITKPLVLGICPKPTPSTVVKKQTRKAKSKSHKKGKSSGNTIYMVESKILKPSPKTNTEKVVITRKCKTKTTTQSDSKSGYNTVFMTESEMLATREEAKSKVQYTSTVFKCELCVIGFYSQQQVEDHFVAMHRKKPGHLACKVCYVFVPEDKLSEHTDSHYWRYACKLCGKRESSTRLMQLHVDSHVTKPAVNTIVQTGEDSVKNTENKKDTEIQEVKEIKIPPAKTDLEKLLPKSTIVGYKCTQCEMIFKNPSARMHHVDRAHKERVQCDICKKRFVNKSSLIVHLRLHEGPVPRIECPICHKMVTVLHIRCHVRRHKNQKQYECKECNKVFSHLDTYRSHLKYSRQHASEDVFKFPCPMCHKGYPTKQSMQDHFNYQHLGKTTHKCPICDKAIATRRGVANHLKRTHQDVKERARNKICQTCGKAFRSKKSLDEHELIHSGERPLCCSICGRTFRQSASLYTHKRRVHNIRSKMKVVEHFGDDTDRTDKLTIVNN